MNKKGFMFIETIVMCAILMVALLIIYNNYTSAIAREKERLNYNTIAGEYKLYYIKRYLIAEKDSYKTVIYDDEFFVICGIPVFVLYYYPQTCL